MARARLVLSTAALGGCLALGTAHAATASDPIVGKWKWSGGVLQVSKQGSGFKAVAPDGVKLGRCVLPAGTRVLTVRKFVRSSYGGTHVGDATTRDCTTTETGIANVLLTTPNGRRRMMLCVFPPDGSRRKRCFTLRYAGA